MTERPILFSGPMVRALLAGSKTQTRRAAKLPHQNPLGVWESIGIGGKGCYLDKACTIPDPEPPRTGLWHTRTADMIACPYGKAGDRLWVRESHYFHGVSGHEREFPVTYAADHPGVKRPPNGVGRPWRPSIHLPRWACRIVLDITGIRAERLHDISEADAEAEGADKMKDRTPTARDAYRYIWEAINGHESWAANPWVWVVEFKRADPVLPKDSINK